MTTPPARAPVTRRPGGRSARVRAAVLEAAADLIAADGPENLSIAEVARRAEVNPTTIYRRWGGPDGVVLDVEIDQLETSAPVPDTGDLRGDLRAYGEQAAASLAGQRGLRFAMAVVAASTGGTDDDSPTRRLLLGRAEQIQTMLDRAADRGEPALHYVDVLDGVLAPVYLRRIFGLPAPDATEIALFVDRLLGPVDGSTPAGRSDR